MINRVLVHAGPIVAILAEQDHYHRECVAQLAQLDGPLLTCWPVVVETVHLLRRSIPAISRLVKLFDDGALRLLRIEQAELVNLLTIMKRFENLGSDIADAALVYLAQREEIDTILTLDRRDFSVYRGPRNRPFKLLPAR